MIPLKHDEVLNAAIIYQYAHYSASSLLFAFEVTREVRGAARGMTTDQEQDLLRAMLVMVSAGLDSAMKQLIRDALPKLVAKYPRVQDGLERFVQKAIKGEELDIGVQTKFLAKVLAAPSPHQKVMEEYVYELTGDSLQSVEQLLKVVAAFGLDEKVLKIDPKALRPIFVIRNQIIHDMDMDLGAPKRKRNLRALDDMCLYTDSILYTCYKIINAVNEQF